MRIVFLLVAITFIFGCKKDRLKDDKSVLIGKWKWVYTIKSERSLCNNPEILTTLTPSSENISFSIEFKEKGCVTFFENDKKKDKFRIVFTGSGWSIVNTSPFNGYYEFAIYLNNKDENVFYGFVSEDTLVERGYFFPYTNINESCISYTNYFVRE